MNYPTLQHPARYVWDFWYYFDSQTSLFHIFYLNADPALVPSGENHNASVVGYGVTKDFMEIEWGPYNVLCAHPDRWDNTSIWSGDIIKIGNGFLMFYTSRNRNEDDGQTQNVGAAYARNIDSVQWEPVLDVRIKPDPELYEPRRIEGDLSTHAWRDPFLFRHDNQFYMLLTAKSVNSPLGRNGAVAVLRAKNRNLYDWEILPPLVAPQYFSEMEVAQLLAVPDGELELVFSCADIFDFSKEPHGEGGLLGIHASDIRDFSNKSPHVLLPYSSGLYACRIIPEMEGEIIGFDRNTGGIRRSGVKTGLRSLDRNFSDVNV